MGHNRRDFDLSLFLFYWNLFDYVVQLFCINFIQIEVLFALHNGIDYIVGIIYIGFIELIWLCKFAMSNILKLDFVDTDLFYKYDYRIPVFISL